jgi:GNAT superfamily N-acetyltransferase
MPSDTPHDVEVHPLTAERWPDLERLFARCGWCSGCWCMSWRVPRSQFTRQGGQGNKQALKNIVDSGDVPGLLAYIAGDPAGWCSVGPREVYTVLGRSPVLKPIDDAPVWSIVCFAIASPFRRQGLTAVLLRAAIAYAKAHGARIVEGYPVDRPAGLPPLLTPTGAASTFRAAGFREVLRRTPDRPIMRYTIE